LRGPEGEALQDLRNTRNISGVIPGGKFFSPSHLDGLLSKAQIDRAN
jgi:hypothetical protein